ncbi:Sec-independent protein translocase subunit TatA [Streptomyces sp. SID3343]|uniref:Sec-independent protein translocase subunit TatA n=1 Tax=Streptomyces sp. SID3343 TaxID=2690260 RepID=UPI00136AB1CB|nr:Sec-independent protein translocase subunit TatA [Streptomyces sp. SID3343]MYV97840.1 Sec-independent protein translocase subunit TatA [Streptomyces sp. SID3343]
MLRNAIEPWHVLIVVVVAIMLFGSKKLPDTARALGRSMRILKSEAAAMKKDGASEAPPSTESPEPEAVVRPIQPAPTSPADDGRTREHSGTGPH